MQRKIALNAVRAFFRIQIHRVSEVMTSIQLDMRRNGIKSPAIQLIKIIDEQVNQLINIKNDLPYASLGTYPTINLLVECHLLHSEFLAMKSQLVRLYPTRPEEALNLLREAKRQIELTKTWGVDRDDLCIAITEQLQNLTKQLLDYERQLNLIPRQSTMVVMYLLPAYYIVPNDEKQPPATPASNANINLDQNYLRTISDPLVEEFPRELRKSVQPVGKKNQSDFAHASARLWKTPTILEEKETAFSGSYFSSP